MAKLTQPIRLAILCAYVALLLGTSKIALHSWLPPLGVKGIWFYSGLAAVLLGSLLLSPFFTKPSDAVAYGVAALVALLPANAWLASRESGFNRFLWTAAAVYIALVLVAGIGAIALKDARREFTDRLGRSFFALSTTIGTPRSVFSAVVLFAIVAFHRTSAREYLAISLAWTFTVVLRPLENLASVLTEWWAIWRVPLDTKALGEIAGHELPGVVLVRHRTDVGVNFGDVLVVPGDDGRVTLALALDYVGLADDRWLRARQFACPAAVRDRLRLPSSTKVALRLEQAGADLAEVRDNTWTRRNELIGLVAPETSLSRLRVEIVRVDKDLKEGRLLEVNIGDLSTLYQVVDGLTREEIVHQKSTRGYVRVDAKKIGRWDSAERAFKRVSWMPSPNASVYLVDEIEHVPDRTAVGHLPGTNYPLEVELDGLVTHNAAILGILGAGKSYLAFELVERMILHDIKVVCLDLTEEYAQALGPYYNSVARQAAIADLQNIGAAGRNAVMQNVEEGGSHGQFKERLKAQIHRFLDTDGDLLRIFNPALFEIWRQDSRPYQGNASMATLTPVETTRLLTEVLLEELQALGLTPNARCCLVLEEAHSLIPEWNAVATDGDKTATNGTAKAIVQGRKYGLGCLVITQRTANITKSILNQCNTIFAMRSYDATGLDFLRNYVGAEYADVLSTLEDRHAIVFGKGSSCSDPLLVRLNDRDKFLELTRANGPMDDAMT
jgi:hypothetical protein